MDNKRKSNVIQDITLDDLADCFKWGVDYGLLLAEQERDSEDLLDAVVCASFARRMNIPSSFAQRRQPHSCLLYTSLSSPYAQRTAAGFWSSPALVSTNRR